MRYFLGLEITRPTKGMFLYQWKYVSDIIRDTGLQDAKTNSFPFPKGLKIDKDTGEILLDP